MFAVRLYINALTLRVRR